MIRIKFIVFIIALFSVMFCAQAQDDVSLAQKHPQAKEVVLSKNNRTKFGFNSYESAYKAALREASQVFPNKEIGIRDLKEEGIKVNSDGSVSHYYTYSVVELPTIIVRKLLQAISKATYEIETGSSFALDKLTVLDNQWDKERIKGEVVSILLGKGYKVVAKERLEKLYKEQQDQKTGIYNANSSVKSDNFTPVGYFISTRITEEYVQVQVVNVSTGEYEGNITESL